MSPKCSMMSQSKGGPPSVPPDSLCAMASAMLNRPCFKSLCTWEHAPAQTRNASIAGASFLFQDEVGFPDHFLPLRDVRPQEIGQRLRSAHGEVRAFLRERRLHRGAVRRLAQLGVQLV